MKRTDIENQQKAAVEQRGDLQRQITEQRQVWFDEMRADKEFGGENFDNSMTKVNQVLKDYGQELTKQLDESKAMLPPYVVKMVARIGQTMYGNKPMIQGQPKINVGSDGQKNLPPGMSLDQLGMSMYL